MSMVYCSCKNCGKSLLLDTLDAAQHGYLCDECISAGAAILPEDRPGHYVVIVIDERELVEVKKADSLKEGVIYANALLTDILKAYDDADKNEKEIEDDIEEDEGVMWAQATFDAPNAWCNYRGRWDAYVYQLEA